MGLQLQFVRDAEHVRVHRNTLNNAECFVQHYVGGFAAHSGQLLHELHIAGDFAAEFRYHYAPH